jgi:cell shape-determining protein MreC
MRMRGITTLILLVALFSVGYFFLDSRSTNDVSEADILRLENEELKRLLAFYDGVPEKAGAEGFEGLSAKVFSSYPFNDRNLIVLSAGEGDGIKVGMPVISKDGNLLGQVLRTHKYYSVARTIFDPGWSSPVRINDSTDGLLVGGVRPKIELIEKEAAIDSGSLVNSADKNYPYGLLIGSVGLVDVDPAESFQTATLNPVAGLNSVRTVFVITDFSSD